MGKISNAFCPNNDCKDYGIQNRGNIALRGKYGKDKTKDPSRDKGFQFSKRLLEAKVSMIWCGWTQLGPINGILT